MTDTLMSVFLLAGMLLTGSVTVAILLNKRDTALQKFAVLGLFCAIISLISYYIELNGPDFSTKVTAVQLGYIGKVFVTPLLMILVLDYYDAKLSSYLQGMMFVIPIMTLSLVFRCRESGLYYKEILLAPDGHLQIAPGPFYFIYMGSNMLLALIYVGFCLYRRAGLKKHERRNNTILLFACLVPFFSLLIYFSGLTQGYDVTNIGLTGSALLIATSVFHYGLLDKEEMLQSMATALIFLDSDYHLVYANHAAEQMMPALTSRLVTEHRTRLKRLCGDDYSVLQIKGHAYQRKISDWSSRDGQHGFILTFNDITEIHAKLNQDAMTGLFNHASFYPMLDEYMEQYAKTREPLTVSIADIDSFKHINDTYGHANGDIILIALAGILQEVCGKSGDVFRYGGEEFSVIFRCGKADAERFMQEALDRFSAEKYDFADISVTFSYGSAQYNRSETSVALFDRADQIMYKRKKALHAREQDEQARRNHAAS